MGGPFKGPLGPLVDWKGMQEVASSGPCAIPPHRCHHVLIIALQSCHSHHNVSVTSLSCCPVVWQLSCQALWWIGHVCRRWCQVGPSLLCSSCHIFVITSSLLHHGYHVIPVTMSLSHPCHCITWLCKPPMVVWA